MRPGMLWLARALDTWHRARSAVCRWLQLGGAGLISYGVVYWWKDLPDATATLLLYGGQGCLSVGGSFYLRSPVTERTMTVAIASFTLSGLLQLGAFAIPPWQGGTLLTLGLACAGAAHSFSRLRHLRRASP